MSLKRLWLTFWILFIIVGCLVLWVLFGGNRPAAGPIFNHAADSAAPVANFDPAIIPGSEPHYEPKNQPPELPALKPQPPSESAPDTPTIISNLKVVSYRGLITEVGGDFIEFIPLVEGEPRVVRAPVSTETAIWRHEIISAPDNSSVKKTRITLSNLSENDDVVVNGWAQDYFVPLDRTTEIIKLTH